LLFTLDKLCQAWLGKQFKTSISALDEQQKTEPVTFADHLNTLEDRLQSITDNANSLSEKLTDAIIIRLTKPDGLLSYPTESTAK
jgi:hypothetical protein